MMDPYSTKFTRCFEAHCTVCARYSRTVQLYTRARTKFSTMRFSSNYNTYYFKVIESDSNKHGQGGYNQNPIKSERALRPQLCCSLNTLISEKLLIVQKKTPLFYLQRSKKQGCFFNGVFFNAQLFFNSTAFTGDSKVPV